MVEIKLSSSIEIDLSFISEFSERGVPGKTSLEISMAEVVTYLKKYKKKTNILLFRFDYITLLNYAAHQISNEQAYFFEENSSIDSEI